MANQRKKGKKLLGVYVDKSDRDEFKALCKAEGKKVAVKLRELIEQSITKPT